jgi:hypothetical protein
MTIEEPTVGAHPIGEPHAGLVVPHELFEFRLGELGAARAHQMLSAIMLPTLSPSSLAPPGHAAPATMATPQRHALRPTSSISSAMFGQSSSASLTSSPSAPPAQQFALALGPDQDVGVIVAHKGLS